MSLDRIPGSFRDPSGFLYWQNGVLLRQVNSVYLEEFEHLTESGLYDELVRQGLLIPHELVDNSLRFSEDAAKVIKPEVVEHISYPYEWSFSQLKDAALLTLKIQKLAFSKGMTLKDASAYNVQFHKGRPVFIDTLSFEKYEKGTPWVAYRQFCQHFLAPLALMAHTDISLNQLYRTNIDGVPLPLATKLLPKKTKFNVGLYMHIWMHAKSQQSATEAQRAEGDAGQGTKRNFSETAFLGLLDSLQNAINKLDWKPGGSEWHDYYEANNNYGEAGLEYKEKLVSELTASVKPATVWDMGGNTGRFSRLAAANGASVVTWDIDPGCVESNYRQVTQEQETAILPLLVDLSNPGPALGWNNNERMSISERGPAELMLALGLIHHLAISNNVPFQDVAQFFARNCDHLLIEFVPRGDSQIDKLLSSRKDVFTDYEPEAFEAAFGRYFSILEKLPVPETKRTLYLMRSQLHSGV